MYDPKMHLDIARKIASDAKRKKEKRQVGFRLGVLSFLCLVAGAGADPGNAQEEVLEILERTGHNPSKASVLIQNFATDSVLVAHNADSMLNPASVQKLITAAAANELLGQDYRFKTAVYLDSVLDRKTGATAGNIYVRGGGDPGFLAERLWLFVQHLNHQGLRKIDGDLVLDDSFFDTVSIGPGYDGGSSSRAYEAPIAALSASFNTVAIHALPGHRPGAPLRITALPRIKGVRVVSTAKTLAAGGKSAVSARTEKMDGKTAIVVYGGMAIDEKPRYIYRRVWETWENFGWVLQALFEDCGIEFNGTVRRGRVPGTLRAKEPFYTFESEPLSVYVGHMFKYSSNFAAEMLFKTIAAEADTAPGSWPAAARRVNSWWKANGLGGAPGIVNGSGMGNQNRVSPRQVVSLLRHVWANRKDYAPDYVASLSTAGADGTLKSRFKYSPLKHVVRAKTGTLNSYGVSTLAGYVFLPQQTYVFAILINDPGTSQYSHWTAQEKILEAVIPHENQTVVTKTKVPQ